MCLVKSRSKLPAVSPPAFTYAETHCILLTLSRQWKWWPNTELLGRHEALSVAAKFCDIDFKERSSPVHVPRRDPREDAGAERKRQGVLLSKVDPAGVLIGSSSGRLLHQMSYKT